MINVLELTKNRLAKNPELTKDYELFQNGIREIMQELILPCLAKNNFFENNAFQGGTALRILYGLKRYSKDLDFTMKENKINEFSWQPFIDKIKTYGDTLGIKFDCKESKDKFGNIILKIKSDSILDMLDGKNIVPQDFTNKNNRKKISVKLETNYSVNTFNDEIKTIKYDTDYNIRAFDLPSLFAGKINAVLTREETNEITRKKERIDHGRDWYDLIWYIDKGIKPNYDFLSNKLNYQGPFEGKNINTNVEIIKKELFKRMEGLDYNILNRDIASITLKEYRIILTKDLLTEKINLFGQS
jgi:predicted nucleotidyltransferase component of viral defense system